MPSGLLATQAGRRSSAPGVYPLQLVIPVVGLALAVALHLLFAAHAARQGAARRGAEHRRRAADGHRRASASSPLSFALSTAARRRRRHPDRAAVHVISDMGTLFGIKAFAVAILGGIGSAWGVVLAGLHLRPGRGAGHGAARLDLHADRHLRRSSSWRWRVMPNGLFGRAEVRRYERDAARRRRWRCLRSPSRGLLVWRADKATRSSSWRWSALTAIVGVGLNVLLGLTGPGLARPCRLLRHRRLHGRHPHDRTASSFWLALPLRGADRRRSSARCSRCRRCACAGPISPWSPSPSPSSSSTAPSSGARSPAARTASWAFAASRRSARDASASARSPCSPSLLAGLVALPLPPAGARARWGKAMRGGARLRDRRARRSASTRSSIKTVAFALSAVVRRRSPAASSRR